ncbi:hypothetical protein JCM3765_004109 [Sporobolomyces pararoseus]
MLSTTLTALILTSILSVSAVNTSFKLIENLQGSNLTQAFNWETGGGWDNLGIPLYVNQVTARRYGLWTVRSPVSTGQNVFRVDGKANVAGPYRMSTRISTKKNYNGGGLFVFDVAHIPVGYGLWPALWMVGLPDWPNQGEIDVIEGVHMTTKNTQSFHTGYNCSIQKTGFTNSFTLHSDLQTNCSALATENQGCSTRDGSTKSYGAPFNAQGGGVFMVKWDFNGVALYSYPRNSIPSDILAGTPDPEGTKWGTPTALLSNANCSIFDNFSEMKIVLNTNICGSWAGGVWNDDLSYAGSPGSPANKTRTKTCEQYILSGGYNALKEAYWIINSIKIYNETVDWQVVPTSTSTSTTNLARREL